MGQGIDAARPSRHALRGDLSMSQRPVEEANHLSSVGRDPFGHNRLRIKQSRGLRNQCGVRATSSFTTSQAGTDFSHSEAGTHVIRSRY